MPTPTITIYTDVSWHQKSGYMGWAYIVLNENGKMIGFNKGAKSANELIVKGVHFEEIPKKLARKRYGWATIKFMTDMPVGAETYVGKKSCDPWHLVVHYAASHAAQRLAMKNCT